MGLSRRKLEELNRSSSDSHHFANVRDALVRLESFEDVKPEHEEVFKQYL